MKFRGSQVALVVAFVVLLIVVGTVGYARIEGWNRADSFYMTIITITAVGYHEVGFAVPREPPPSVMRPSAAWDGP